ncbi:YdeI/OmpD-associated family protein [Planctomycetaceae bacterium SH139]
MLQPTRRTTKSFLTPDKLADWLEANHASESELWVKVFKKKTGKRSVTWSEIVTEALCWGWIDGIKKSIDDEAYLQRITPRQPRSIWSKRNRENALRLISEGRMRPSGMAEVEAAKADGRWENAYPPASESEVPADFVKAVERNSKAKCFYKTLSRSSRFVITTGLTSAKKQETRERRFQEFIDMLVRGEEPTFGLKKGRQP